MKACDAARFRKLHQPGDPLRLATVWDAGSAKTVEAAGAHAVATSSWATAAAMGAEDGERLDFDDLVGSARRIARSLAVPLSVDIERGYAEDLDTLIANVGKVLEAGAAGINIEDGLPGGRLRPIRDQAARLSAIRGRFSGAERDVFINARCDAFFGVGLDPSVAFDEVRRRARAYAEAGADGLFIPGLNDPETLSRLRRETSLALNVMATSCAAPDPEIIAAGAARISYGPHLWLSSQTHLGALAREIVCSALDRRGRLA